MNKFKSKTKSDCEIHPMADLEMLQRCLFFLIFWNTNSLTYL